LHDVDTFFASTLANVTRVGLAREEELVSPSPTAPSSSDSEKEDKDGVMEITYSLSGLKEGGQEGEHDIDGPVSSSTGASSSVVQPEEWADLTFSVYLPDGTRLPLVSGGEEIPVTLDNWREYVQLAERARLKEGMVMYKVIIKLTLMKYISCDDAIICYIFDGVLQGF
jgi:hypothetical protein